jgi:hypothetical protein
MRYKIQPTVAEQLEFESAVQGLSNLALKVCEVRGRLVMAGCGTFRTANEFDFLNKLEARLDKMRASLYKKQKIGEKNMPANYEELTPTT